MLNARMKNVSYAYSLKMYLAIVSHSYTNYKKMLSVHSKGMPKISYLLENSFAKFF